MVYITIPSFITFRQILFELSHGNESVEEEQDYKKKRKKWKQKQCLPVGTRGDIIILGGVSTLRSIMKNGSTQPWYNIRAV